MTPNLTNTGHALLLRALEGTVLKFTRLQLGNGTAQDAKSATALSNPLATLPLTKISTGSQYVTLTSTFSNNEITAGFRITEVGIFAEDPDNAGSEILYALGNEAEGTADYVPSKDNRMLELEYSIVIFVGEAQNVSAEISESLAYASAAELKAHIENQKNPHGVTKAQVGLGAVPNVGTNDQTPTYTQASTLTALKSGEKLGAVMGKLARAVGSLIDHLADKVSHVTAAERTAWDGKADGSHTHGASDINKGTLGVTRGGTGKTSWIANRLLYPTAAAALGQLPFPSEDGMFLCQDKSGAPFWAKIAAPSVSESGTYTGTGKSGSDARNSITFSNGLPKIVFIKQKTAATRWGMLLCDSTAPCGLSVVDDVTSNLVVSMSGNTVYWYYSQSGHAANQLDTGGQAHTYVGIF